jgi:hypothetical protein
MPKNPPSAPTDQAKQSDTAKQLKEYSNQKMISNPMTFSQWKTVVKKQPTKKVISKTTGAK